MINKKSFALIVFLLIAITAAACNGGDTTTQAAPGADDQKNENNGYETSTQAAPPADDIKSDNNGNYEPDVTTNPDIPPAVPPDTSQLQDLSLSVTAQKSLSGDSITILAYVQGPGVFTVEEKISQTWQATKEGIFYAGSGGLRAGEIKPGEESKTLRLLKIENGRYTAVTKEIVISRTDVISAGGIKTYD